jgi:hypothetical protein
LPDPTAVVTARSSVLGRWDSGRKPLSAMEIVGPTDVELHMEREDPAQPTRLTVTLLMRPAGRGLATPAWRSRCNEIGRDLQAYLMER